VSPLAGLRAAVACAVDSLPAWVWRAFARTPQGRAHERRARLALGMGGGHPERVTLPPKRRDQAELDRLQAQTWPEAEYAGLLRLWLEDGTWGEKR
jgi:hypothetical protein